MHMSDITDLKQAIANRMAAARKNAGLSQGQAAKHMAMHRPTISEIEAGRRNVTAEELNRFSELYGVEAGWLSCSDDSVVDANKDRLMLAAREIGKLKQEDLEKVINLLSILKGSDKEKK